MPQRILVTGGSGFIGRNLAELLAARYLVTAPARNELDLTDAVAVEHYLKEGQFDVVLHAATGRSNRKTTAPELFKNNVRMFFNLARHRHLYGKMLSFGSGAEFGTRVARMPESFFDTYVPQDDYGFAKYVIAQYIEAAQTNIYNLRLFGVFGKYEAWEVRFISNAICRPLFGLPILVRQNVRFDYLYVHDLARLAAWFIEHEPRHKTYNICRGETLELTTLASLVATCSLQNPEIGVLQSQLAPEYGGDNARLLAEMGGFDFTPIDQAVAELTSWYTEHRHELNEAALQFDG